MHPEDVDFAALMEVKVTEIDPKYLTRQKLTNVFPEAGLFSTERKACLPSILFEGRAVSFWGKYNLKYTAGT